MTLHYKRSKIYSQSKPNYLIKLLYILVVTILPVTIEIILIN